MLEFVFSLFRVAFFRYFVFSPGVFSSFRPPKEITDKSTLGSLPVSSDSGVISDTSAFLS